MAASDFRHIFWDFGLYFVVIVLLEEHVGVSPFI
jgi:hypothetical protein